MTAPDRSLTQPGREQVLTEIIDGGPSDRLAAALDRVDPPFARGTPLPHAWHWLHFHTVPRASQLTADGRGSAEGLLPGFPGLARMWAGGSFAFERPIHVGERIERRSHVTSIVEKQGRSGPLVLASVEHTLTGPSGSCATERQDIVFRQPVRYAGSAEGEREAGPATWRRELVPDEVLLFCFSAVTYNPHRIHYDFLYATQVEGYPGLLVHGPLTCVLLLDFIRRSVPERTLTHFDYRALRPLICGRALTLAGRLAADRSAIEVWAEDDQGFVAMRGKGRLA
jgi:3-methylfumaryl-CoA hydratase